MVIDPSIRKKDSELTLTDFMECPIWSPYDDEGDEVVPVEYPSWKTTAIGGESCWILGEVVLLDKSSYPCIVNFHIYHKVILNINIYNGSHSYQLHIYPSRRNEINRHNLSIFFDKKLDQILPLIFVTPFSYLDGTTIKGIYS